MNTFAGNHFDLVLMDIHMPEMDGITATKIIRASEEEKGSVHVPVIAVTASLTEEDQEICLEAGMDGIVGKPIDFSLLFSLMEKLVTPEQWKSDIAQLIGELTSRLKIGETDDNLFGLISAVISRRLDRESFQEPEKAYSEYRFSNVIRILEDYRDLLL